MKRIATLLLSIGFAPALAVFAQQAPPAAPPRPITIEPSGPGPEAKKLEGEAKLRWVLRQLRMTPAQLQDVEQLITIYNTECKEEEGDAVGIMMRIQNKYAEIREAENSNDKARVAKLKDEMRELAPGRQPERHYFESLDQYLTPEQKQKLPGVLKRAETGAEAALRPVHVLKAAQAAKLTPGQMSKLETLLDYFRSGAANARPQDGDVSERVEKLVTDVRALLNAEQTNEFDKAIEAARENPPAAKPVEFPGVPAAPPPPPPPGAAPPALNPPPAPPPPAPPKGK